MKARIGLVLLLALALFPAAASASGYEKIKPFTTSYFQVPATNGFDGYVELNDRQLVASLTSENGQAITYSEKIPATTDGSFSARLPGVGRIDVSFEPTHTKPHGPVQGCKGKDELEQRGVFRGTIEIAGEGGFATVDRSSASGTFARGYPLVCKKHKPPRPRDDDFKVLGALVAIQRLGSDRVYLFAERIEAFSKIGEFVGAVSVASREGMDIVQQVSTSLDEDTGLGALVSVPGSLADATLAPPAPFSGSATFHLNTPTEASWTGTLVAPFPTGPVALTAPGFYPALCGEKKATCTATIPGGFDFSGIFREDD